MTRPIERDLAKTREITQDGENARFFEPTLLGFGLLVAWSMCMPQVRDKLVGFSGPATVSVTVHGLALIVLAVLCNRHRACLFSRRRLAAGVALAYVSPLLSMVAGLAGPQALAATLRSMAALCEGSSLALLHLLWNEQYARRTMATSWPCYAASFGIGPLMFCVLNAVPLPLAAAATFALPLVGGFLLWHAACQTEQVEAIGECVEQSWQFPWKPALIMTVFSFAHYMLMHLFGGAATPGQVGSLVVAGTVLIACVAFFDRFDPRVLYKLCPPLMVCALLSFSLGEHHLMEIGYALAYAGFTGFGLFMSFILSSICFRYGVHAAWLFGIVEGCSVLAHMAGSFVGQSLLGWSAVAHASLALPLDAVVVVLVLLSMLLLSERDFVTTWGIHPAGRGSNRTGGVEAHSGAIDETAGAEGPDLADRCARIARHFGLTHREEEVLALLTQGKTASDIESVLFISHNTVKGHIRHVYAKLGVHSRDDAVELVRKWR